MKIIDGISVTCCAECPRMDWPKRDYSSGFFCEVNGKEIISQDGNLDVPEWCPENVRMHCEFREAHPHSYMPDLCNIAGEVGEITPYCSGKNPCFRLVKYYRRKRNSSSEVPDV